ncbi:hypothetical protein AGLY_012865 [Aphis glycines]|uniref:Uncharacterized protein n=1 Tax=Aphis glycines TaxID=307491 RepID=A0A6G0T9Z8_APHGL|nr:hypothetical protein AGLY_012865 [Aphis glycines]
MNPINSGSIQAKISPIIFLTSSFIFFSILVFGKDGNISWFDFTSTPSKVINKLVQVQRELLPKLGRIFVVLVYHFLEPKILYLHLITNLMVDHAINDFRSIALHQCMSSRESEKILLSIFQIVFFVLVLLLTELMLDEFFINCLDISIFLIHLINMANISVNALASLAANPHSFINNSKSCSSFSDKESFDLRSAGRTTKSPDVQSRGKFLNSVATHLYGLSNVSSISKQSYKNKNKYIILKIKTYGVVTFSIVICYVLAKHELLDLINLDWNADFLWQSKHIKQYYYFSSILISYIRIYLPSLPTTQPLEFLKIVSTTQTKHYNF